MLVNYATPHPTTEASPLTPRLFNVIISNDESRTPERFPEDLSGERLALHAPAVCRLCVHAWESATSGVDETWQAVRNEIPSITRESVFRILCEFASHGLVARLDSLSSARFDSNPKPHGHFICEECGAIIDFALPEGFSISPELKGATVSTLEVRMTGLCPKHSNEKRKEKKK